MFRILSLKDALRAGILLSLCLSLAGLSSCSDDDEDPDAVPTVSFENLENNSTVWNTVSATLDVDDDKGVAKVEVYVDGVLIQTLTTAPYELTWNTASASDGTHTVKVVVIDEAGNETNAEISVTVKNILFSMDVAADQLYFGEWGYIVLTDDNGEVIASTEYRNGEHIELRSSDFNGEKFTVTEVLAAEGGSYYPVRMWTYPQVERGSWTAYEAKPEGADKEQANLSLTNAVVDGGYYRFVTNGSNYELSAPAATYEISPYMVPPSSKLYVVRYNDDPSVPDTYRILESIVSGDNPAINLSQVNQSLTSITVDVPQGASGLDVNLDGYPVAGNYSEYYNIDYFQSSESPSLQIQYPGSAFPAYYSQTYYATNDFYFMSGRTNAFYNTTAFTYSGEFGVANNKLTYSASGNYDFATIAWIAEMGERPMTRWVFVLPKGSAQSVAIPQLAETLSDLVSATLGDEIDLTPYIPDFTLPHDGYSFHEYEPIEGFDGLKTFIRNSDSGIGALVDRPTNYTTLDIPLPENGRVGASQGKAEAKRRVSRVW